jgi:uncharacterized protein (TIGR03000 family)
MYSLIVSAMLMVGTESPNCWGWGGWDYSGWGCCDCGWGDYLPNYYGCDVAPSQDGGQVGAISPSGAPIYRDRATVDVRLPADAKLYADGSPIPVTSSRTIFVTPQLQDGKDYNYRLEAVWSREGKTVRRSQSVSLRAGQVSEAQFREDSTGNGEKGVSPRDKDVRGTRNITVEILIADVATSKEIDADELNGTIKDVNDRIDSLTKKGLIDRVKRLELTVVEDRESNLVVGGSTPYVTGITTTGGGTVSKSVARAQTGAEARLSARMTSDGQIQVELKLKEQGMRETEVEIGKDEKGAAVPVMELLTSSVESKLVVAPEHARVVEGVKTQSKSGKAQTLVIVTARLP